MTDKQYENIIKIQKDFLEKKKDAPRAEKRALKKDIKEIEQARAVNAKYEVKPPPFHFSLLSVN